MNHAERIRRCILSAASRESAARWAELIVVDIDNASCAELEGVVDDGPFDTSEAGRQRLVRAIVACWQKERLRRFSNRLAQHITDSIQVELDRIGISVDETEALKMAKKALKEER